MYLKDLFDAFSEEIKAKLTKLAKAWPNKFVFIFFWGLNKCNSLPLGLI